MERYNPKYNEGLNNQQVQQRIQEGLVNKSDTNHTKSYQQIIYDNIFTLFNFINFILAGLVFITGSYRNMLFLGVVFSNIIIGTYQEIRAKITLDKIALIVTMKISVIRNGKKELVGMEEIVLDDILELKVGNQIVSDCILISGEIEVDESLLTGESETVIKRVGDFLYSGSFVVGSTAYAKVEKIGNDNYAAKMVKDAKKHVRYPSQLRDSLNQIIKVIGIVIIPLGIVLFIKTYYLSQSFNESILTTTAALIGMIPEGLVILTSIALAVGTIHLAKHKTLVQELYCLETLARVDTLCLDKTGTITEGKMAVEKIEVVENEDIEEIMGNMIVSLNEENATFKAIENYFQKRDSFQVVKVIPFTSKRKYSGVVYTHCTYLMGAAEFLFTSLSNSEKNNIATFASAGYRVITLVKCKDITKENQIVEPLIIAHFLLVDKIRESAIETLTYFREQGVDIKVISGDNPITVSQVAKKAGLENYEKYIDATTLHNEEEIENAVKNYQIFGRVTPQQKKAMIVALKKQGHTVGMSGDGVNDVLAFKEANISIAMASGSDVAKASANLVLLDSNFDALPYVLYEGRRVINNIQRVATLFLTKTTFSAILAFIILVVAFKYPFIPIQLTFVSTFTIGIPAFLLALEPNGNRVQKNFLENVIKISIPSGISVVLCILYIFTMTYFMHYDRHLISQLALIAISLNGIIVLAKVAIPFSKLRAIIFSCVCVCMVVGILFGNSILEINSINMSDVWFHILVFSGILLGVTPIGTKLASNLYERNRKNGNI